MSKQYDVFHEGENGLALSSDSFIANLKTEPRERCWLCPSEQGQGHFQRVEIRRGFELWISDCTFHRDIVFKHGDMPPVLQFTFVLSGNFDVYYDNKDVVYKYRGAHQGLYYSNKIDYLCKVEKEVPMQSVCLILYPEFFKDYFDFSGISLPTHLDSILTSDSQNDFRSSSPILQDSREIAQQIMGCRLEGIGRKLFFESKALELVLAQLNALSGPCTCPDSPCNLPPHDRARIEQTKNYLISNMETPPCLHDLARNAGMSHPKLNRCFKQVYGMTVFQYLRQERLNKAKAILENEGLSVTETAYQVGYDSISHFSQAFRKQFGKTPKHSLKVA